MKKQNRTPKLAKDTLRTLATTQLDKVAGGGGGDPGQAAR